jgi:hypothetical protein
MKDVFEGLVGYIDVTTPNGARNHSNVTSLNCGGNVVTYSVYGR